MKRLLAALTFVAVTGSRAGAGRAVAVTADVAKKPSRVKGPANRNDEYYWLRDDTRKNPEMLAYLNAENAYADALHGAAEAAAGQAVRGDRRPHQAGRQLGAVPRARLLVLHALRDRHRTTRSTRAARAAWTRPKKSCSTSTRWPRARIISASATGRSARTTRCSPGPRTPSAAASTRLKFHNLATGKTLSDDVDGVGRTWSGPTTTARSSTSRTIRRRCSPSA